MNEIDVPLWELLLVFAGSVCVGVAITRLIVSYWLTSWMKLDDEDREGYREIARGKDELP